MVRIINLFILPEYKTLPSPQTLYDDYDALIKKQFKLFIPRFQDMIYQYIIELNNKITEEQDRVSRDFGEKLTQAHTQQHDDYEKVICRWQPLHEQSQQLSELLKQLVHNWESI